MKKYTVFIFIFVFSVINVHSQNDPRLIDFNSSRNKRTEVGLKTLGAWSIANIGASGYLYYNSSGSDKYFHQMNVFWNGINLIIAGASLIPEQKNDLDLTKTLKFQSNIEAIYIANAMLDLVYMAGGLYLTEKAKNDLEHSAKFNGWGNSIIMQGGFLLLLDTTMFIVHKRNGKNLYKLMDKVTISTSGLGIKLGMQL
ncbi:MAG: DUF6992 family protein [Bacteroidota bacterium]